MYNSEYGELEFDFNLRDGKYCFYILDKEDLSREFSVIDPNGEYHRLNWESESIPSIQDVRIWILLGMPELASKEPLNKKHLTVLTKEKLRSI